MDEIHEIIIVPDGAIKYTVILGFGSIRDLKMILNGDSFIFEYLQYMESNDIMNINIVDKDITGREAYDTLIVPTDGKPISCSPSKLTIG